MSSPRSFSIKSLLARHETVLVLVILFEVILFQVLGRNFLKGGNVSNVFRHSVEIGLLAVAMTPVILTGGIDLSVGSMMGLCAVLFGMMVNGLGMDPWLAGFAAVAIGALGGGVNAMLITRLNLPPLIVTLGTFSLFRGLAEALTKGAESYSGFPPSFLALGNSSIAGFGFSSIRRPMAARSAPSVMPRKVPAMPGFPSPETRVSPTSSQGRWPDWPR